MILIGTGETVVDYLTNERRLAERRPEVGDMLDALKDTQNIAEELMYQGSLRKIMPDAWKMGTPLACIPQEVFLTIANLHPEWFSTIEGKRNFMKWLNKHPAYRYYRAKKI